MSERSLADIDSEIAVLKAAGQANSKEAKRLYVEKARIAGRAKKAEAEAEARRPQRSDDLTFVHHILQSFGATGDRESKIKYLWQRVAQALDVKHVIEDLAEASGWVPGARIALPAWSTLGRDETTGHPLPEGVTQAEFDGHVARKVPKAPPVEIELKPARGRSVRADVVNLGPDRAAEFVTAS